MIIVHENNRLLYMKQNNRLLFHVKIILIHFFFFSFTILFLCDITVISIIHILQEQRVLL